MSERPRGAIVPGDISSLVVREAKAADPNEACGLLVGVRDGGEVRVVRAVPCANDAPVARRPRRFEIDPRAVIAEEKSVRGSGREVVGFYHSHPVGEPVPSSVDRGYMALWPDAVWLIVGLESEENAPRIRAWVAARDASEAPEEVPITSSSMESDGGAQRNSSLTTGQEQEVQ